MKRLEKLGWILLSGLLVWGILSFAEINIHSLDRGYEYSKLNFFNVLVPKASMEMAEHEASKVKKPLIVPEFVSAYEYTDEELELLAHVINAEGGAATWVSDEMCYGIGSVVLNRVESDIFPNSIKDVIYQSGQYASTWDGNWNVPISDRSIEIAQELLDEGSKYPPNVLFQANFTQGSGVYKQVQNMYFCYR